MGNQCIRQNVRTSFHDFQPDSVKVQCVVNGSSYMQKGCTFPSLDMRNRPMDGEEDELANFKVKSSQGAESSGLRDPDPISRVKDRKNNGCSRNSRASFVLQYTGTHIFADSPVFLIRRNGLIFLIDFIC